MLTPKGDGTLAPIETKGSMSQDSAPAVKTTVPPEDKKITIEDVPF